MTGQMFKIGAQITLSISCLVVNIKAEAIIAATAYTSVSINAAQAAAPINAEEDQVYVCYRFLQPYMSEEDPDRLRACDTYTNFCTQMSMPQGFGLRAQAECKLQKQPCSDKWLLYGQFNKNGNVAIEPQPYAYQQYDRSRSAEAAYEQCVTQSVIITPAPFTPPKPTL